MIICNGPRFFFTSEVNWKQPSLLLGVQYIPGKRIGYLNFFILVFALSFGWQSLNKNKLKIVKEARKEYGFE
jgi:hypothetical protein